MATPPDKEIVDYVKSHRDVVMTIYDASGPGVRENKGRSGKTNTLTRITQDLDVPIITLQRDESSKAG